MALAAGLVVPDALSGIIAIEGMLPTVPGWTPPMAPLDGLPILLAGSHPLAAQRGTVVSGSALADRLTSWGATVTACAFDPETRDTTEIADWLRAQSPRFGGPSASGA